MHWPCYQVTPTLSLPISNTSFALRTFDPKLRQYVLAKDRTGFPHIAFAPGVLQKQTEGIFSTDGMLRYAPDLSSLIYVYHYRNQFICTDTNLNILYRGKTIDTITQAQIKVSEIESENKFTLSAPPLFVNKLSCTWKNWLFVNSALEAKNEMKNNFDVSSVIDVYDLRNGSYKFSFYIPDYGKKKIRAFAVNNNALIALYDNYIMTYNLNPHYFK